MNPSPIELVAAALFAVALIHTFSTKFFEGLAHRHPAHAGIFHLLGEVEVVFGFWAMVLVLLLFAIEGETVAVAYVDSRNFTEPMFVFAIMIVAGSRPILDMAGVIVRSASRLLPLPASHSVYFTILFVVPLLGSLITEPAAMTIGALLLSARFYRLKPSEPLRYATLALLFVNVSVGGALTHFAAPPVVMVAAKWGWGLKEVFAHFGVAALVAARRRGTARGADCDHPDRR